MPLDLALYRGREQSYVKHVFLEGYLEDLLHKTASAYDHLVYVDGFSGPWKNQGEAFQDTSFGIALRKLTEARATWMKLRGRNVRTSAFLVEQSPAAFAQLRHLSDQFPEVVIQTYNADFLSLIPSLMREIPAGAFTFFFVDPIGWRIKTRDLEPMLKRPNSELVFNLMFDFLNRAVSMAGPAIVEAVNDLLPFGDWRKQLDDIDALTMQPADRSKARYDVIVDSFKLGVSQLGGYHLVSDVPVLRRENDRTLYSLIYATRSRDGIRVFRDRQLKASIRQAEVRSAMKLEKRLQSSQQELFGPMQKLGPDGWEIIQREGSAAAEAALLQMSPEAPNSIQYKQAWPAILAKYAVTFSELNKIAAGLRRSGRLQFLGWEEGARVPKDNYRMQRNLSGGDEKRA